MPDMNFGDFLDKMSGKRVERPKSTRSERPRRIVEEESKEQKPQKPKEKEERPKKEEKPENTKKEREDIMPKENNTSDDDIVIKALDYSRRFIKVIYDNFKKQEDRRVVLQSIRTAIDLALGDGGYSQPNINSNNTQPRQTNSNIAKEEEKHVQQSSQDEGVELHMNDLSGQQVSISPQQPHAMDESGGYDRNLSLGLKVNNDGKKEADLSRVSQKEINEMRILAGIEGGE